MSVFKRMNGGININRQFSVLIHFNLWILLHEIVMSTTGHVITMSDMASKDGISYTVESVLETACVQRPPVLRTPPPPPPPFRPPEAYFSLQFTCIKIPPILRDYIFFCPLSVLLRQVWQYLEKVDGKINNMQLREALDSTLSILHMCFKLHNEILFKPTYNSSSEEMRTCVIIMLDVEHRFTVCGHLRLDTTDEPYTRGCKLGQKNRIMVKILLKEEKRDKTSLLHDIMSNLPHSWLTLTVLVTAIDALGHFETG